MSKQVAWYQLLYKLTEADQIIAYCTDHLIECQPVMSARIESLERALFETRVELLRARDDVRHAAVEVVRTPTEIEQLSLDKLLAILDARERGRQVNAEGV